MRLATIRTGSGTRAVRVDGDQAVETGHESVGALLLDPSWQTIAAAANGAVHRLGDCDLAPVVPSPGKIVCVGLNYRNHILEMGRDLPQYPTLFAKYADALIGARDDIALAPESTAVDWEAELVVVIGQTVRRADDTQASAAIAGFTVMNDVTMSCPEGFGRPCRCPRPSTVRPCRRPTRQISCSTRWPSSATSP
jgi:acylpyruvate hydrolase